MTDTQIDTPLAPSGHGEGIKWICHTRVDKYDGEWTPEQIERGDAEKSLYDTLEIDGNLLLYGGASCIWEALKGATRTGNQLPFDNTNAYLGVGDSSTAEALTQTDLVAATNKIRKGQDSTYPTHTDGTTNGAQSIVYKSTFGTSEANWVWNEWGLFNASSGGRMLNRKVEGLGTKSSGTTWTLTVTLSLA